MAIQIIKKNGSVQNFDKEKIIKAIRKSATRVCVQLTEKEEKRVVDTVYKQLKQSMIPTNVNTVHNMVECALDSVNPRVAQSYREYRDNKSAFASMLDKVYSKKLSLNFIGDRSNANADSALITTQKAIVYNELNSELYKKFFLTQEEEQAMSEGYIYIHDRGSRLDSANCFSEETKFITDKGMKSFKDFNDGDEVFVPTLTGEWKRAIVHSYGKQNLNKITFKRAGRGEKVVYATQNHRWMLKDKTETNDLKIGDKLIETPVLSEFDWDSLSDEDKKIWVYGFCMADGNTDKRSLKKPNSRIRLCKDKNKYAHYFIDAGFTVSYPKHLFGDASVYVKEFSKYKFDFYKLNNFQAKVFINGYLCADGNRNLIYKSKSPWRGVQVTGNNNDFIYDALNISGYYVTNIVDKTDEKTNYGKRKSITKHYGFYSDCGCRTWVVQNIEKTNRLETVWCLDVEDNHSFILENGIPTLNCCLFDMKNVLQGGFQMGNLDYQEPKTIDVAFDLMADVAMNAAACQYGGFTISEVDKLLAPYAEKSYNKYKQEYLNIVKNDCDMDEEIFGTFDDGTSVLEDKADTYATEKLRRDIEQGVQGLEMKFNSVATSRGDYPKVLGLNMVTY